MRAAGEGRAARPYRRLRRDLLSLADDVVQTDHRRTQVIPGLLTAMTNDEQLRTVASEAIGRPRLTDVTAVIGRGEARPDCRV